MVRGSTRGDAGNDARIKSVASAEVRTLADLARLAGVSAGTVSRALAGKTLVNVETRERIQDLARQHGFRPNQMASKLRTRRTRVIGVVVPMGNAEGRHFSNPFSMTLLACLADELTDNGYDVMLTRGKPDGTTDWLERITGSGMVDGVLVIGLSSEFDVLEAISQHYLPLVTWGPWREGQKHCSVGTDNAAGGRVAAEHLIASGARNLAFLGETANFEVDRRYQGAAAAAREAGVPIRQLPVDLVGDRMREQIGTALEQCGPEIDGVMAASDMIAMNVLQCLHEHGRRAPDDVQVIGFDDLPLSAMTAPPLTTIRQELALGAKIMVEKLQAGIDGQIPESVVIPPRLIPRETTRGPRRP